MIKDYRFSGKPETDRLFLEIDMADKLLTVGEIAKQLDCPIHKVEYIIMSRGIKPVQLAGRFRVFDDGALERIRSEVEKGAAMHAG